ncbi:MAG: ATP-binding protein [Candidatus Sulfotelmatobacter sp.]
MSHHFVLSATMQTVTIEVTQDHIDRLSKARNPVFGLAELIWNSVDADATSVDVRLGRNALGTIDNIRVTDNGLGITMSDAQMGFGHLGGSWKQQEHHTRREKRILHGKQGQGRFRAFALCERVEWDTVCLSAGSLVQFKIIGTTQNKRQFAITDEEKSSRSESGTVATLYNVITQQRSLESDRAVPELNKILALYLNEYPQVTVTYDGTQIQPSALEDRRTDYTLPQFTTEDGKRYEASLTIIEWKMDIERALYLCNTDGFTIREIAPGIQAPGYQFTAYLRSKLLEEMDEAGTIDMEEFTDLKRLLDITKEQLRKHFLLRDAENASGVVARWKEDDIYPFDGAPRDVMEETERQIFDVVAVNLDSYVSEFKDAKPKAKKLTFNLLRYALESNPSSLQFILSEVVGLPKDKQDEFAALLQKTSLIAMINASKIVTDRLDFLKGLEYLLYDPESKPKLKERSQLHKLVSRNTWIFGDEYFLVNNDESLTNVLRKHVKGALLDVDLDTPVLRADGSKGVVDIGLSNIPSPEEIVEKDVLVSKILDRQPSEGRHHLIIELKRPSQDITSAVISQTKSYAFAVAADERFQNVPTNWTFWCLSNKMNEQAQLEAQLDGQPRGVVYPGKPSPARNYTMTIWAKSWAEVIEQCAGRLKFFQERLNYNASQSSGKQFLRDTYPKFIPDFVAKQQSNKP